MFPKADIELTRRGFASAAATGALAAMASSPAMATPGAGQSASHTSARPGSYWPNGARLAISISLMFEGGGQPISGASGAVPEPIKPGYPDQVSNAFFDYGVNEGIPRALALFDKHGIKITSFMIGEAIKKHPELAREIVRRGHEPGAHGTTWTASYDLPREQEKTFIKESADTIRRITGVQPVGWNAYFIRNSVNISETLQDLGFLYSIDDPSRDEPFIIPVRGRDFAMVPYTLHMNDMNFPFQGYDPHAHEQALRDEFDQLYEEAGTRRRLMVIGMHDRLSGHANRIRALDRFFTYARSNDGVWFARKDEIARWALQQRQFTPVVHRGPPSETGLP
jgi:peptidoglycan/xylan/chitin deacetylase (PgdA/CDA1 family)